jgi:hypothetical protein
MPEQKKIIKIYHRKKSNKETSNKKISNKEISNKNKTSKSGTYNMDNTSNTDKKYNINVEHETCYACCGSGRSYWCDGIYGACIQCCCIDCGKFDKDCKCK